MNDNNINININNNMHYYDIQQRYVQILLRALEV